MDTYEIERLIRSLGIGGTYRGFRYLSRGVYLCLEDENYLLSINKLLYPVIAAEFETSVSCVERNIRTVINICWERGYKDRLKAIAMRPVDVRPTAAEFIDIIVGYLRET